MKHKVNLLHRRKDKNIVTYLYRGYKFKKANDTYTLVGRANQLEYIGKEFSTFADCLDFIDELRGDCFAPSCRTF